jgi:nucleotide-binding universal stress UspA family protein
VRSPVRSSLLAARGIRTPGAAGRTQPLGADADVVSNLEPKLRSLIDGLPGQGRVSLDIQPVLGSPASNLMAAADEQAYDLMVVGSHQRHGPRAHPERVPSRRASRARR